MRILAMLMVFLMPSGAIFCQKEQVADFKLPTLSSKSQTNENIEYEQDQELKIRGPLKKQLLEIDRQIKMTRQIEKVQIERAYHYEQKANVFYNAEQFDEYKTYMRLLFETEEKIVQLQKHVSTLLIKRNNFLLRIEQSLSDENKEKMQDFSGENSSDDHGYEDSASKVWYDESGTADSNDDSDDKDSNNESGTADSNNYSDAEDSNNESGSNDMSDDSDSDNSHDDSDDEDSEDENDA